LPEAVPKISASGRERLDCAVLGLASREGKWEACAGWRRLNLDQSAGSGDSNHRGSNANPCCDAPVSGQCVNGLDLEAPYLDKEPEAVPKTGSDRAAQRDRESDLKDGKAGCPFELAAVRRCAGA